MVGTEKSWGLIVLLLVIFTGLALAPLLFEGVRALDTAARICIFIVVVAGYDLLLGYTGIVSFAHTMFFGMGAYGVALGSIHLGRTWEAIATGAGAGVALAVAVAGLIGLFSLRVRAIFFAMITLAAAAAVAVLVSQYSGLTGGEDGLTFQIPRELTPAARYEVMLPAVDIWALTAAVTGQTAWADLVREVPLTGRIVAYYTVFGGMVILLALLLRIVVSPFGRVLLAIRENPFRAEAVGYSVVRYRVAASCLSAGIAAMAGALFALWVRYVGPDTTLSFEIMVDILLMVVIGGMGTIWGAVIGVTLFKLAQGYLQDLMAGGQAAVGEWPVVPQLLDPDRWLLWLGVFFVLSVYFFPKGIAGGLMRPRRSAQED